MKLRCFARCERRGECRGATKGSIAMQSRLTMIDRSRRHRLNASCQCCRLGEARSFRGAVFLRIRATDRACSPSESSIRFVSWSFRPQAASGGRGASPPDPRPAGCRCRRRLSRLEFYFIIFLRLASASFRPQVASGGRGASPPVPRPAGCRRRRRLSRLEFYFIIFFGTFADASLLKHPLLSIPRPEEAVPDPLGRQLFPRRFVFVDSPL